MATPVTCKVTYYTLLLVLYVIMYIETQIECYEFGWAVVYIGKTFLCDSLAFVVRILWRRILIIVYWRISQREKSNAI